MNINMQKITTCKHKVSDASRIQQMYWNARLKCFVAGECLTISDLIRAVNSLPEGRALPGSVGSQVGFHRAGNPRENGYIESFNGKVQDELLNREIFVTLQ